MGDTSRKWRGEMIYGHVWDISGLAGVSFAALLVRKFPRFPSVIYQESQVRVTQYQWTSVPRSKVRCKPGSNWQASSRWHVQWLKWNCPWVFIESQVASQCLLNLDLKTPKIKNSYLGGNHPPKFFCYPTNPSHIFPPKRNSRYPTSPSDVFYLKHHCFVYHHSQ